ncbi:hypothetical protein Pst134EB_014423 [Puccinia striiformis f. sp. tritici]|nr:hypothetical protein Pst134EB_014423 [Puccinia striiformis f. sp. tritici]
MWQPPGQCPGPIDKRRLPIPDSFQTPPKPPNYKPPMPRGPSGLLAGRPTQPPAGRPSNRSASVAGVAEHAIDSHMDTASIQALAALDEELRLANEESYVPVSVAPRIIIDFIINGVRVRGLIDSGSEINMITELAAARAQLLTLLLDKPISISLALDTPSSPAIVIRHHTVASLADPDSSVVFDQVPLRLGPVSGGHDMILGTPFLAQFRLFPSVSHQALLCDFSDLVIYDYRRSTAIDHPRPCVSAMSTASPKPYPCAEMEEKILKEFRDLFPLDIPAISEAAEHEGLFTDGSFPEKLQNESSTVRHKIVLTDPNAVVNLKPYPYPGKHLVAWRTLLDQHVAAGRLRRSTSQYASPSLIIPKKDPSALPALGMRLPSPEQSDRQRPFALTECGRIGVIGGFW